MLNRAKNPRVSPETFRSMEYMHGLLLHKLPYYALTHMLRSTHSQITSVSYEDADAGDLQTIENSNRYFWKLAETVASRMGVEAVSEDMIASGGLEAHIGPDLPAPICLADIGIEALTAIKADLEETELDGALDTLAASSLAVNILMSRAHAELYDTQEDVRRLQGITFGLIE